MLSLRSAYEAYVMRAEYEIKMRGPLETFRFLEIYICSNDADLWTEGVYDNVKLYLFSKPNSFYLFFQ